MNPQMLAQIDAYIEQHLETTFAELGRLCAIPSVAAQGTGSPGSRAHAPDENLRIDDFVRGTKHMVRVLIGFGD